MNRLFPSIGTPLAFLILCVGGITEELTFMANNDYPETWELNRLYSKIRRELEFEISLPQLLTSQAVWKTDITFILQHAYQHLCTSKSNLINKLEQVGEKLLAEMLIRHLIESLQAELTVFHVQNLTSLPTNQGRHEHLGSEY